MQAQNLINLIPEERLLRLIEAGEKGPRRFVFCDVRTWAAPFFPYKEEIQRLFRVRFARGLVPRELNLKLINLGLIVILLFFLVTGIAVSMNRVQPNLKGLFSQEAPSGPLAGEEQALTSLLRPLTDYLREVEKRDLFNPVLAPKPEKGAAKAELVKPQQAVKPPEPTALEILREKAKPLNLVGISWGKSPVAMIEDTNKRETSFLKAGQSINGIKVKAILKDRAILSYGNAEYEIS